MGTVNPVLLPHAVPRTHREIVSERMEMGRMGWPVFIEKDKAWSGSKFAVTMAWWIY